MSNYNAAFADTSALHTLADPDDALHQAAVALSQELRRQRVRLVCTDYIIAELVGGLTGRLPHHQILAFVDGLLNSPFLTIAHIDRARAAAGWALYRSRPDKLWSLTDCISFIVMAALNLQDAFTHDRHFEQAGFRAMLR